MKKTALFFVILTGGIGIHSLHAQGTSSTIAYRAETSLTLSGDGHAPLWLSANRYGLSSAASKQAYLRAGVFAGHHFTENIHVDGGLELAGGKNLTSRFLVHQAYADFNWNQLQLSIGAKERPGVPLEKDLRISSGMMVEGANARPIPQIRAGITNYLPIPFTQRWVSIKGHLAYGICTDGNWQEDFAATGSHYLKGVLYHSKSAALLFGRKESFPLTFEVALIDIAQFGGKKYRKGPDGQDPLIQEFPTGLKSFWKALYPKQASTLENVEGNHSGSWMSALTWHGNDWKIRAYIEHYFEDHSQMFMEYGFWKDGQLGIEVTLPENPWVDKLLWEGLNTTHQTGPILYDGVAGSFEEVQVSGGDNYFNNGQYQAWHHWGMGMTNPLIPGPIYNRNGDLHYASSRVKAHHFGLTGSPTEAWNYRILFSHVRHWGTYPRPLDQVRKQFSGLLEISYAPHRFTGWSATLALATDSGNYLGDQYGMTFTLRKTGIWKR